MCDWMLQKSSISVCHFASFQLTAHELSKRWLSDKLMIVVTIIIPVASIHTQIQVQHKLGYFTACFLKFLSNMHACMGCLNPQIWRPWSLPDILPHKTDNYLSSQHQLYFILPVTFSMSNSLPYCTTMCIVISIRSQNNKQLLGKICENNRQNLLQNYQNNNAQ